MCGCYMLSEWAVLKIVYEVSIMIIEFRNRFLLSDWQQMLEMFCLQRFTLKGSESVQMEGGWKAASYYKEELLRFYTSSLVTGNGEHNCVCEKVV